MPVTLSVTVTNPDGQFVGAGSFTVNEAPQASTMTPTSGPQAGGTTVTITGAFFQPGVTVLFGSRPALNVQVAANGQSLTCVTPDQR